MLFPKNEWERSPPPVNEWNEREFISLAYSFAGCCIHTVVPIFKTWLEIEITWQEYSGRKKSEENNINDDENAVLNKINVKSEFYSPTYTHPSA